MLVFGVTTNVGACENAGRELRYDFLVIGYGQHPLVVVTSGFAAALSLLKSVSVKASRYALAAWVSVHGNPAPLDRKSVV